MLLRHKCYKSNKIGDEKYEQDELRLRNHKGKIATSVSFGPDIMMRL